MTTEQKPIYKDDRGEIEMNREKFESSQSTISTYPGKIRANHYHRHGGGHWVLVKSGQIIMFERPTGTKEAPKKIIVNAGQYWFTPEYVDHIMTFEVETVFECLSLNSRDSATYENDTVRLTGDQDNLIESYNKHHGINE